MFAVFGDTAFIASEYNTSCVCLKLSEDISNKTFGTLLQGVYVNVSSFDFSICFAFTTLCLKTEKLCFGW